MNKNLNGDCRNCHKCLKEKLVRFGSRLSVPVASTRFILCPECGNKRCPKASDHSLICSDSNEPGQNGSVYK